MAKTKRERVEQFFIEYKNLLKIAAWERELKQYRGTISKFYKGKTLTKQEINEMDKLIVKMIESYY